MPEVQFTIDPQTGQLEMHVQGIAGPSCDDVAKITRELLGAPGRDAETAEYHLQPQVRPQIRPGRGR
jgi:hypothetical protein